MKSILIILALMSAIFASVSSAHADTHREAVSCQTHAAEGPMTLLSNSPIHAGIILNTSWQSGFLVWQADPNFHGAVTITGNGVRFTAGDFAEPDPAVMTCTLHLDAHQRHFWTTLIRVKTTGCYTLDIRGKGLHERVKVWVVTTAIPEQLD